MVVLELQNYELENSIIEIFINIVPIIICKFVAYFVNWLPILQLVSLFIHAIHQRIAVIKLRNQKLI